MRATLPVLLVLFLALGCSHKPASPLRLLGVWHPVEPGDTVASIAERYGADPLAVAELNDLTNDQALAERSEIFIPKKGGRPPGAGAQPPARGPAKSSRPRPEAAPRQGCGKDGRPCLKWPVEGRIASTFGPRPNGHHDGVDIAAKLGTPVTAAADGRVLYSGSDIKGYGNLIIVQHADKILTVYAHNRENLVKEGDKVKAGQVIGKVGNSGSSKEIQLHFEVRLNENPVDPLLYLP